MSDEELRGVTICAKHRELFHIVNARLCRTTIISLPRGTWWRSCMLSCHSWYLCFCLAWRRGKELRPGVGVRGWKRQTWTCEWGPLLLQIINLQWDPSISHRTLKCIPDALKDWILKKKKNQIIEGGKDLNIYQTSGEKRLVKLGSVRKDHRERDGQNWLQKNLAHLYIKTEGRTYAGKKRQAKALYL